MQALDAKVNSLDAKVTPRLYIRRVPSPARARWAVYATLWHARHAAAAAAAAAAWPVVRCDGPPAAVLLCATARGDPAGAAQDRPRLTRGRTLRAMKGAAREQRSFQGSGPPEGARQVAQRSSPTDKHKSVRVTLFAGLTPLRNSLLQTLARATNRTEALCWYFS